MPTRLSNISGTHDAFAPVAPAAIAHEATEPDAGGQGAEVASTDVRVTLACRTSEAFTVTPGVLDERATVAYTMGQCHALALALLDETGWEPVLVLAHQSERPRKSWADLRDEQGAVPVPVLTHRWVHVAVAIGKVGPDPLAAQYLDIEGSHSGDDLVRHWRAPLPAVVANGDPAALIVPTRRDVLHTVLGRTRGLPRPDLALARTFIVPLRSRAGV